MNLQQLGTELGLVVHGNERQELTHLAPIESAGPDALSFVVGSRFTAALRASNAGAVIVPHSLLKEVPGNALVSESPYASYARASWLLHPEPVIEPGIHASAMIAEDARICPSASIGPGVVVGPGSIIGENAVVGAHCCIGSAVRIGAGSRLFARVTLYDQVRTGQDCRIQSGAVIGSEGFGYAWSDGAWSQIRQIGGVDIGHRVHIGANTTIDCGAIEPTVIEDGVILDNQIQVAHNVYIGRNTAIAGCTGIAGSTRIGSHCQIGGACNIVGHLSIADEVIINAASLVTRSITTKGRYGSGMPLQEEHAWRRSFVNLGKLDRMFGRIRQLERRLAGNTDA